MSSEQGEEIKASLYNSPLIVESPFSNNDSTRCETRDVKDF